MLFRTLRAWKHESSSEDLADDVQAFAEAFAALNFDVDAKIFCGCGDSVSDPYYTYAHKDPDGVGTLDHGRENKGGESNTTGYTNHFPFTATALHYAMKMKAHAVVQWLLQQGADPSIKDHLGRDRAWYQGHGEYG